MEVYIGRKEYTSRYMYWYWKVHHYRNYGIGWLFPKTIDTLEKGNERLRVINWHKTKCAYEEALICSRRTKEPNHQAQYFKKKQSSQLWNICNVGLGLWLRRSGNLIHRMGETGSFKFPDSPEPSGPAKVAHSSQLKVRAFPKLEGEAEATAFVRYVLPPPPLSLPPLALAQ